MQQVSQFRLGNGSVLVRAGVKQLFVLNASASLLWQRLALGDSQTQIAAQWHEQFGISLTQAQRDIEQAVMTWRNAGLLGAALARAPVCPPFYAPVIVPAGNYQSQNYRVANALIRVQCSDHALTLAMDNVFVRLRCPQTQTAQVTLSAWQDSAGYHVAQDKQLLVTQTHLDSALNHLHYALLQQALHSYAWLTVLHAGAVSRQGQCLLLAGCGGSGKSTLTAALLAQGFSYLSDDLVALDEESLTALPLPVPLTIKQPSWALLAPFYPQLDKQHCYQRNGQSVRYLTDPYALCAAPQTVAYILFLRLSDHAALRPVEPQACLQRLMQADLLLPEPFSGERIAPLLTWLQHTRAYELSYRDTQAALDLIAQLP